MCVYKNDSSSSIIIPPWIQPRPKAPLFPSIKLLLFLCMTILFSIPTKAFQRIIVLSQQRPFFVPTTILASSSFSTTTRTTSASTSTSSANINMMSSPKVTIIILTGPTAVGKSKVAALLCQEKQGIIISADSVQTYCGVHIGANKPSVQEQLETPHLLIDVVDTNVDITGSDGGTYNAADWRSDALFCIETLVNTTATAIATTPTNKRQDKLLHQILQIKQEQQTKNGKMSNKDNIISPIVVGGTMMYLTWLVDGIPDATPSNALSKQKAIEVLQSYTSWEDAVAFVSSIHPIMASRVSTLSTNDWYRLSRSLEIAYATLEDGTMSTTSTSTLEDTTTTMTTNTEPSLFTGQRQGPLEQCGNYDVRCFFLCPTDRMEHSFVIDERCEEMLLQGLLEETTTLYEQRQLPDMVTKAIGYRQALEYLERPVPKMQDVETFHQFINDFKTATRRYAKKQMQWFRKLDHYLFIPINLHKSDRIHDAANQIMELASMSRDDYNDHLCGNHGETLSAKTKSENEKQGKGMKFYMAKHHVLQPGSNEFNAILQQADQCTARIQQFRIKNEELMKQQQDKPNVK